MEADIKIKYHIVEKLYKLENGGLVYKTLKNAIDFKVLGVTFCIAFRCFICIHRHFFVYF